MDSFDKLFLHCCADSVPKFDKNYKIPEDVKHKMLLGKSFPCECSQCEHKTGKDTNNFNNNKYRGPGSQVPYKYIKMGVYHCRDCVKGFKCSVCNTTTHILNKVDAGLYSDLCIDCTRCERCGEPMWDYECGECLRKFRGTNR